MEVPFSMAIGNGELMQEYFPKHSCMETARLKYDNGTDEDDKKRGVNMEKSKAGTKEISPDRLSQPNLDIIIINKIW